MSSRSQPIVCLDNMIEMAQSLSPSDDNLAYAVLEVFQHSVLEVTIDWEPEAGESWARYLVGDQLIAMLHCGLPLLCCKPEFAALILGTSLGNSVTFIIEPDFSSPHYSVTPSLIESAMGIGWPVEVNPDEFSLLDLWWATV